MQYKIQTGSLTSLPTDALLIPVFGKNEAAWKKSSALIQKLDQANGGHLGTVLAQGDLDDKVGKYLLLPVPQGLKAKRLILMQAGKNKTLSRTDCRHFAAGIAAALKNIKAKRATLSLQDVAVEAQGMNWLMRLIIKEVEASQYRFTECKGKPDKKDKSGLTSLHIASPKGTKGAARLVAEASAIAEGVRLTKDLGNRPANQCTPTHLANQAKALAKASNKITVKVLGEAQMKKLGMGAFLSVTAGSVEPAKLVVLEYKGGAASAAPVALVGKGITFDTGGISIKPSSAMDEMKYDMCGAASVLGVFKMLSELALPLNVVGILAAAENMPSGEATKPGDVVTSMSGQTIEVLNTDAEGRLVLCDCLTYVAKYKPRCIVDIATLTGACVVALGKHASGLYANDDALASALLEAGEEVRDRAWRMPLWEEYQRQIDGTFADISNIGSGGAGSVTAACFLARFTKKQKWAHLDVAGTAWNARGKEGASGRPVFLLCQYLLNLA